MIGKPELRSQLTIPQTAPTDRDVGDLGDRLHLLNVSDADFGDPEGAADVGPLVARAGALHRSV